MQLSSGRGFQSEGTKCADFLRQEYAWHSLGHSKEASVAEQNAQSKGACRKQGREAVGRQPAPDGLEGRPELYSESDGKSLVSFKQTGDMI